MTKSITTILVVSLASTMGCRAGGKATPQVSLLQPSHNREWEPTMAVLPTAEVEGNLVRIRNVRDFRYVAADVYVPRYEDRFYDLEKLQTVDYMVVPFQAAPDLAHTMLSFGFSDGKYLAVSVEARREQGEKYTPLGGLMNRYELMYVVADERDVIPLRTAYRGDKVQVYRTTASPEKTRALFVDILQRVNQIAERPEFYHTLTNNCTTNIRDHIEKIAPGRVPWNVAVLLPGHSAEYAYRLGLIDTSQPFTAIEERSNVTQLANRYVDDPQFSQRIRQWR